MQILKLGMDNPRFRNPKYTHGYKEKFRDEDELFRYESYAYIVWNICETVYDRGQKDENLAKTWLPIVGAENKLHREWFDNAENNHKFKDEFIAYIKETFPNQEAA
jgi:hypothetical protein